jgi:integrase/recombinase XerD
MLARAWLWRRGVVRVQKIRVPDTGHLSWIVIDREHVPVGVVNEYLVYLHRLGRSPNTVRAYAHHLQAYWAFLVEQKHDWHDLKLTQLAEFVSWVRHATRAGGGHRCDATINLILAAIGSFYEYQDRLGVETAISRSRRFGAKSPYKPFLHHISRTQSLRHAVVRVKAIKRLPRVFSPSEVQSLLDSCTHLRDRFLLCLLHESGMRIGQALGLRHADIRSYDGAIDIVPRTNGNGALAKSRSPYVVHVSKQAMALYADYLVHEYGEVSHDYVFVNWWGGQVGAPMRYATAIDLFRQLSKRTGLRATPHMFRHYLPFLIMSSDFAGCLRTFDNACAWDQASRSITRHSLPSFFCVTNY